MTAAPPNRGWIWYLVVVAVLTAASVTGLIAYNLRQQLRPDELAAARARWAEHGPRGYNLGYRKSGSVTGAFEVEVRAGKVRKVTDDGRPLEAWQYHYHSMDALFDDLDRLVKMRDEPGGTRIYLRAEFDPEDGHLLQYLFSDSRNHNSVQVLVQKFEPVASDATPPGEPPG